MKRAITLTCLLALTAGCSKSAHTPASQANAVDKAATKAAGSTGAGAQGNTKQPSAPTASIAEHTVKSLDGKDVALSTYKGKVALVVNTASQCGFTRQYADLQSLQDTYGAKGFTVLAFPSNDYGGQEPGDAGQIRSFVDANFKVTFPMFAKIRTKGDGKAPLYKTLTERTPASMRGEVRWNFTKFLVNKEGTVIARFSPSTSPTSDDVTQAIEKALQ